MAERQDRAAPSRPLPAERVFSLVATLLASPGPVTREEILDRLRELYVPLGSDEPDPETLRKMFERDKRLVKEMGLPLVTVEGGQPGGENLEDGVVGYLIDEQDLSLPTIRLSPSQRLLLAAVGETLLGDSRFPLGGDLALAVHKILLADEGASGDPVLPTFRLLLDGTPAPGPACETDLVETVLAAIQDQRSLEISYRASDGVVTRRVVDPHGLAPVDGSWLLTGHCHLRDARRTFAMHRVLEMAPARPGGEGPDFEPPGDFDARDVARVRPWQYEAHDPVEVVIEADRDFEWHATQLLGRAPDPGPGDGVRYTLSATNLEALVELAIVYGPRIRVAGPGSVKQRVVDRVTVLGRRDWVAGGTRPSGPPAPSRSGRRVRRDDSASRLRRFLFLVSYLTRNREVELDRLAGILGVDRSILLRDLERLSLCGVYPSTDFRLFDVSVDESRGLVRFRKNPVAGLGRPVRLSRTEVVALLVGLKVVRDGIAPPFDWEADRVIDEVVATAGEELADAAREMEKRISLVSRHELSWDTFYEVSTAVCQRRRLEIEYYTRSRDAMGSRIVRPYVLVCTLGRWYLLAHCEWRSEVRTFRLDRIRRASSTEGTFTPPDGFDPARHLGSALYPEGDPPDDERCVVEFDPGFIEGGEEREDREFLEVRRSGQVTFAVHPDRHEGFLSWLLGRTTRFVVVEPPRLAKALERRRQRILMAYQGG